MSAWNKEGGDYLEAVKLRWRSWKTCVPITKTA